MFCVDNIHRIEKFMDLKNLNYILWSVIAYQRSSTVFRACLQMGALKASPYPGSNCACLLMGLGEVFHCTCHIICTSICAYVTSLFSYM